MGQDVQNFFDYLWCAAEPISQYAFNFVEHAMCARAVQLRQNRQCYLRYSAPRSVACN
ncbi:hypothetical protein [Rhizobium sp. GN54]|uniref:hypothetical protein n=1 Tax=Rhizobium sp. GN54 TaxID=2898150 RepID=UPI001E2C78B1|nr:hypothetical protein [Rhizobium sp. GN54]MCD2183321.1 hypothetical protein [Rhizobium sp. GN54]